MRNRFLLLFVMILALYSCKKNDRNYSQVVLTMHYAVDDLSLQKDTVRYLNNAGNLFSVTHLEYYISDITFHDENGRDFHDPGIHYMNGFSPQTNQVLIDSVPCGTYTSMTCHIGLSHALNVSHSLTNTAENVNMAWPDNMGGGYHFLKMEGYVKTPTGTSGYVVHLGTDTSLVTCIMTQQLYVFAIRSEWNMTMNINEWYRSPAVYNLLTDGNNTMGNPSLMSRIAGNGYNVFTLQLN